MNIMQTLTRWFNRLRAAVTNTVTVSLVMSDYIALIEDRASSVTTQDGKLVVVFPDGRERKFPLAEIKDLLVTV